MIKVQTFSYPLIRNLQSIGTVLAAGAALTAGSSPALSAATVTLAAGGTAGDSNEDGSVNMADLNRLVDFLLGRIAQL